MFPALINSTCCDVVAAPGVVAVVVVIIVVVVVIVAAVVGSHGPTHCKDGIFDKIERITKKMTKNKAKMTKPDSEWKRL
ncbi:hypothetical protein Tco_0642941 [Tanacetum coccineum]